MKAEEVVTGGVYLKKVSKKLCRVVIKGRHPDGGWVATNVETGRRVLIKTARSLRMVVGDPCGWHATHIIVTEHEAIPVMKSIVGCGPGDGYALYRLDEWLAKGKAHWRWVGSTLLNGGEPAHGCRVVPVEMYV